MKEKEIWKDVKGYEGYYQVSDLGRIRNVNTMKIVEAVFNSGYRKVTLTANNVTKIFKVSQLVAIAFLNHKPNGNTLIVDHINGNKVDDRVVNLKIVTHRENLSTCFRADRKSLSSKYVGVSWQKAQCIWVSKIKYNGHISHLGSFRNEIDASNAYQLALSKIKDGSFDASDYKPKFTSKYKGVSFSKQNKKWIASITIDGKMKYLGSFLTELEAHKKYQSYKDRVKK